MYIKIKTDLSWYLYVLELIFQKFLLSVYTLNKLLTFNYKFSTNII